MLVLKTLKAGQTYTINLREPLWVTDPAISVEVKDFEDAAVLHSGTAVYSSSTWTTAGSAAAGRGTGDPKILTVSDPTGLVVGRYFLIAANGAWEKVQVVSVQAARVELAAPLQGVYAVGSTLKPAVATYTVDAAVVDEERDFGIHVDYYTAGGRVVGANDSGYVSDAPAGCPVVLEDLFRIWPQLQAQQQTIAYGNDLADKLEAAWERVRGRLLSKSLRPEQFKVPEALRQVVVYEFGSLLATGGTDPSGKGNSPDFLDRVTRLLERAWAELWNTEQFVDRDETGKAGTDQNLDGGRAIEW